VKRIVLTRISLLLIIFFLLFSSGFITISFADLQLTQREVNAQFIVEEKNAPDAMARTEELIRAINEDNIEMTTQWLNQGMDINSSGYNHTPLTAAVYYGHKRMVEFLIEKGADVNRADKRGMTPLGSAVANANRAIYDYLKFKKAMLVSTDPAHPYLHLAIYGIVQSGFANVSDSAVDILADLLRSGNPVDQIDGEGTTPIWQLATHRPVSIPQEASLVKAVEIFIQNGAIVDWIPPKCNDFPKNHIKSAEINNSKNSYLLAVGSDRGVIDSQTSKDYLCRTPLMNAVAVGNKGVAEMLIKAGANVNWQSPVSGMTPLMHAAFYGDPQVVSFLLEHGADPKLRDAQNKSAVDIAQERGNTKALTILKQTGKEPLQ
jgi:ankyrin repeat protein